MDPFGKGTPGDFRASYARLKTTGRETGQATQRTEQFEVLDRIVAPEDLAFARQESARTKTDLASVLIAYGLISGPDYCLYLSQMDQARYFRGSALHRAAAVCAPTDVPLIAQAGQIPVSWNTEHTYYATALPSNSRFDAHRPAPAAITTRQEMGDALRHTFRDHLCTAATQGLAHHRPVFSAARRLTPAQAAIAVLAVVLMGTWFLLSPQSALRLSTSAMTGFFLSVIVLRALVLWPPSRTLASDERIPPVPDDKLPSYSILVPLFGEANMVPQLLEALCDLDYPAALLDIKLILEEGDANTLSMVHRHQLPGCFEIIVVPPCAPQTKPKALNFALPFATGEFLTIFDAEDIPEPEQLRLAVQKLRAGHPNLACVQAKLAFYNSDQNWLTRQFTLEYASLFDVVLPGLAEYRLPLPLGGTSNHFRTRVLREVGGWDPYNVTEDADLGMRLDRLGYRVDVLESSTYEEAVCGFRPWIRQRSRWLKGWMQTWLVHMRSPIQTWRDMGPLGFMVFQVLMGGIVVSSLVHPFFLAIVLYGAATGTFWPSSADLASAMLFAMQTIVLLTGYGVMMLIAHRACKRRRLNGFVWSILAMPFYWLLLSLAGWLAVWQLLTAPFYWEKTKHGLSSQSNF